MNNEIKKKIRKPTGVFIMCAVIFLNFGVYQFIRDFVDIKSSEQEIPVLIAVILFGMDALCAASAIWAFFGDNAGRISLLIFVSLNMLWSVFILIISISFAQPKANGYYDGKLLGFGLSLIKPLILCGLCWWYFTQKEVNAYYKQDNNYEFF